MHALMVFGNALMVRASACAIWFLAFWFSVASVHLEKGDDPIDSQVS